MDRKHPIKLAFKFFTPLAILVITIMLAYGTSTQRLTINTLEAEHRFHINQVHGSITENINRITRDLMYLSSNLSLTKAINQPSSESLTALKSELSRFSENMQIYDQIRWIDEQGMERVRVDLHNNMAYALPDSGLQNKSKRYYFVDSFKLNRNEIFISPLDLNIENGKVEQPFKPMIRVASPVFDDQGKKHGIIITNYLAHHMLSRIQSVSDEISRYVSLLNNNGFYLHSDNPNSNWGFMLSKPELTLAKQNPVAWQMLQHSDQGQVVRDEGLWTWHTIRPLKLGQKSSTGANSAFTPSISEISAQQYQWKIVSYLPVSELNQIHIKIWFPLAAIATLLLLLVWFGSYKLGQSWNRQTQIEMDLIRLNSVLEQKVKDRTHELSEKVQQLDSYNQQLVDSDATLHSILSTTMDGFWIVSQDGVLIDVNHTYCLQSGYTREELLNLDIRDIDANESDESVKLHIHKVIAEGRDQFETLHRRKNGSLWHVEVSATYRKVGGGRFFAFIRDIDSRKKSQHLIHQKERHFRLLLQASADGIYGLDIHGTCTFINRKALSLLGYEDEDELIGHQLHKKIHHSRRDGSEYDSEDCPSHQALTGTLKKHRFREWFWRKDGSGFPVEMHLETISDNENEIEGAVIIFNDITQQVLQENAINFRANHDTLTGLPNRELLHDRIQQGINTCKRENKGLAILFIDLDNFKPVNDTHGHEAGDFVLRIIAERLRQMIRESDTAARFGGDEFVVLMSADHPRTAATKVGRLIAKNIGQIIHLPNGQEIAVGCSIGVSIYPDDGQNDAELIKAADMAMYATKHDQKQQLNFASSDQAVKPD